ncbi:hypothetical protein Q0M94_22630 (plasmid) [Deinococcus radiomollis]|uniref:hypothetical protein n=1 Tax=Deinococcus radiomollis TaxID=468916 RepID=UPI003891B90F
MAQKLSRLGYRDLQSLPGGAPALVARNGTNEVRLTLTSPGQLTVSSTAAPQFVVPVNTQIWTALAHLWHEAHPWNKEIA